MKEKLKETQKIINKIPNNLDIDNTGKPNSGNINQKPSVPRPSATPPAQRSIPSEQNKNDK
jgi:hypothetical protein